MSFKIIKIINLIIWNSRLRSPQKARWQELMQATRVVIHLNIIIYSNFISGKPNTRQKNHDWKVFSCMFQISSNTYWTKMKKKKLTRSDVTIHLFIDFTIHFWLSLVQGPRFSFFAPPPSFWAVSFCIFSLLMTHRLCIQKLVEFTQMV